MDPTLDQSARFSFDDTWPTPLLIDDWTSNPLQGREGTGALEGNAIPQLGTSGNGDLQPEWPLYKDQLDESNPNTGMETNITSGSEENILSNAWRSLDSYEQINTLICANSRVQIQDETYSPRFSPMTVRNPCIEKLIELSSILIKDTHTAALCQTACSFLFTASDPLVTGHLFKVLDDATGETNPITKMLHGSESFLEILKQFKVSPLTPKASDGSHDHSSTSQSTPKSPAERGAEKLAMLQTYLDRSNQSLSTSRHPSDTQGYQVDSSVEFAFAISKCYKYLLKMFDCVFKSIHHLLECAYSVEPALQLPPMVRGLKINGFQVQSDQRLQVKILIEVSKCILESIQNTVSEILVDETGRTILHVTMSDGGWSSPSKNDVMGTKGVLKTMENAENILRGH